MRALRIRTTTTALVVALAGAACTTGSGSESDTTTNTSPTSIEIGPVATKDELDAFLADLMRRTEAPGGIVAMQRGDEAPVVAIRGNTGDGSGAPIVADAQWPIASITKSFVGALAVIMAAEGSVDLDAPISVYLDHPNADRLTLRQLLTHTSGLPDFGEDLDTDTIDPLLLPFDRVYTSEEALRATEPLAAVLDPQRRPHYSNANYVIAGAVLERVAATSFGRLVRDKILEPLGLGDTRYLPDDPADRDGSKPMTGLNDLGDGTAIASDAIPLDSLVTLYGPAASIVSDLGDLLSWADTVFRTRRVGSIDLAAMIDIDPGGYGLGVAGVGPSGTCIFDGCPAGETFTRFSLAGDFPGASTRVWYDPPTDTILLVYLNRNALALDEPMTAFLDARA